MTKFKRVAIVGVGLIGGSIGLAIRKKRLAAEVVGIFRRKTTLHKALEYGAVDRGTMNVKEGVERADIILLATPVSKIPFMAREVIRYAKDGAVITDAGSTKAWIVSRIERMIKTRKGVFFVGSHPMAGSEQAGVEHARADLPEGAACIVTKTRNTDSAAIKRIAAFWASLGGRVSIMSPAEHDRIVGIVSHLPHIAAFSLAGCTPASYIPYAAEGFKDTTRVASSDSDLWSDIFLTNRSEIYKAGRGFVKQVQALLRAVRRGDRAKTQKFLRQAKSKRDRFFS